MRKSWGKLVQHVGTKYGKEIRNELNIKLKVNLVTPAYWTEVLMRHAKWETLVHMGHSNIQVTCWEQSSMNKAAETADPSDMEISTKISIMDNKISKGDYNLLA